MRIRQVALWVLVALAGAGILSGCANSRRRHAPVDNRSQPLSSRSTTNPSRQSVHAIPSSGKHTVAQGETLYSISRRYGLNYRQVAQWNGLKSPYLIYPGRSLRLSAPSRASSQQNHSASSTLTGNKNQSNINNTQQNVENVHQVTVSRSWKWPTKGRVVRRFDTHDPTRNGIDIAGVEGQPVYVADAGRVVYSGNGLASYGNLIIVRHDDRYLTAYGYNAEVLIKEGDELKAGTMIARMGKGPDNTPKLHFQVRVDGKPVNPLNYLPK